MNPEAAKVAILLNGPPRAGKDTAVTALESVLAGSCEIIKFTRPVKDLTHLLYGLDVPHDHYEVLKDTPLPEFNGLKPREAYIQTSENLKREKGVDAVARLFVEAALSSAADIVLNPDCGDDMEAIAVADAFSLERTLVIRISREGHDFSQDCRTWVEDSRLKIVDVENRTGRVGEFEAEVIRHVTEFLEELRRSGRLRPAA